MAGTINASENWKGFYMKTVEQLKADMFATLCELQSTEPEEHLKTFLTHKLQFLVDTLEDDVPGEYYDQLELYVTL